MKREDVVREMENALEGLKDFQRATVDVLYRNMFGSDPSNPRTRRMLVADEVGLGKTIVARGLIARIILGEYQKVQPNQLKLIYICSNMAIAGENVRKLNPFTTGVNAGRPASRIGHLAYRDSETENEEKPLVFDTLTPNTSFYVTSGSGDRWERAAIYGALVTNKEMAMHGAGLRRLLRSGVTENGFPWFERNLKWAAAKGTLREDFPERFLQVIAHTEAGGGTSLYDETLRLARLIRNFDDWTRHYAEIESTICELRGCLIDACLQYLDADIYILDEFQRFRDLINTDVDSDQARLAEKVFRQKQNTRLLLLSATPFKAFTGISERIDGEDHYEDFRQVLRFLFDDDTDRIVRYERHRGALYRQLLDLRQGQTADISTKHREAVEELLRSVMCRTERQSIAVDPHAMVQDTWKDSDSQVRLSKNDIDNFRVTDQFALALSEIKKFTPKPVEYCKSAPFPLSFLDSYKFKESLRHNLKEKAIKDHLNENREAWLDFGAVDTYTFGASTENYRHGRLQKLFEVALGQNGENLLWVPPSMPYYPLAGVFAGSTGFSKTLLFSSWIMVPRMIATLSSYEVERRTVGNPDDYYRRKEQEPRRYFTPTGKKRHPIPQLLYTYRSDRQEKEPANMSNFTLLYPSKVLADLMDPLWNVAENRSGDELHAELVLLLKEKLKHLSAYAGHGESERWYWAAPLLLDREAAEDRSSPEKWLKERLNRTSDETEDHFFSDTERRQKVVEGEAQKAHWEYLLRCVVNPSVIGLGKIPPDLAEVLARLVLGSPAINAFRMYNRIVPGEDCVINSLRAVEIAEEFVKLYNKPESIEAVRRNSISQDSFYWRQVLEYGTSGCLQAVLDEFLHLAAEQAGDHETAHTRIRDAINLRASTINVDSLETFREGTPFQMRCHYAVEFGSQRLEKQAGSHRAKGLREVFNSPFRPFLLATTSIGQEGLDFHQYCRRIVHWNLPSNPVDFEQREGRINRYKGLVIRQRVANSIRTKLMETDLRHVSDVWSMLFDIAAREEGAITQGRLNQLVPFWHIEKRNENDPYIERIIPLYPYSSDWERLARILETLAVYRLAFGQPRQTELVDHLLRRELDPEEIRTVMDKLMINLSPIRYSDPAAAAT